MPLFKFLKTETLHILPVFIFFLISFSIINEALGFLFLKAGMSRAHFLGVLVAAGLIAKIVLVLDHIPYMAMFSKKPLIYSTFWKTFNYSIILFVVRFLIRYLPLYIHDKIGPSVFWNQFDHSLFTAVGVFETLFLFIYVAFAELAQKLGNKKLLAFYFGAKTF
jgi:hypothetical protein